MHFIILVTKSGSPFGMIQGKKDLFEGSGEAQLRYQKSADLVFGT